MKKILLFTAVLFAVITMRAEDKTWDFMQWSATSGYTNGIYNGLGLYACSPEAETQIVNFGQIETGQGSKTWEDGYVSTVRFKLNGGGFTSAAGFSATPTQRYVHFNVEGNSTIKIWFRSGGSGNRVLYITDGTNIVAQMTGTDSSTPYIITGNYTGGPATIYIFGDTACNLYKITATNVGGSSPSSVQNPIAEAVYYNGSQIINEKGLNLQVYNVLGKLVRSSDTDINTTDLQSGIYIISAEGLKGALKISK